MCRAYEESHHRKFTVETTVLLFPFFRNRQSNSYVLRQRIIYAQAAFDSGWSFTGGQQWSLATENKKGIQNRQEAIPLTIDSQYTVGFTWERQYGFRVVKDFGGKFALGVAVEGPQATIGGRGFSLASSTTVGSATTATTGNTFLNAPGAGGGLFNFVDTTGYSVNKAPDIIVKASADPKYGHYELFGIISTFRNRVYPCGVVGSNATDTAPPATPTTITCPVNGSVTPSSSGATPLSSRTGNLFDSQYFECLAQVNQASPSSEADQRLTEATFAEWSNLAD